MGFLRDLRLTTRLALLVVVFALSFGAFAYVSFGTLERVRVGGADLRADCLGKVASCRYPTSTGLHH
ncbi:MAG: hypothetical protein RMJ98_03640 [Myxococcales bacterium]|nr:hypothetical protein [Myxococcales bacterium]